VNFLLLLESTAPSRLGDCWRRWQEKEIVLGHLRLTVTGSCAFLGEVPKATLLHCVCVIELPHLRVVSCGALRGMP
jgi:hypothetical protein